MYHDEEFWDEDYYITNVRDGEPEDEDDFDDKDEKEELDFLIEELEEAGLDYDELCWMDEEERNKLLEKAGLDPDDYDFER